MVVQRPSLVIRVEFVNSVSKSLFGLTKTRHNITSAYHPQSNDLVERYNQTLQRPLIKLVNEHQDNWDVLIDGVLLSYRTAEHKSTGLTSYEVMFCRYTAN